MSGQRCRRASPPIQQAEDSRYVAYSRGNPARSPVMPQSPLPEKQPCMVKKPALRKHDPLNQQRVERTQQREIVYCQGRTCCCVEPAYPARDLRPVTGLQKEHRVYAAPQALSRGTPPLIIQPSRGRENFAGAPQHLHVMFSDIAEWHGGG